MIGQMGSGASQNAAGKNRPVFFASTLSFLKNIFYLFYFYFLGSSTFGASSTAQRSSASSAMPSPEFGQQNSTAGMVQSMAV